MGVLSDIDIAELSIRHGLVTPFVAEKESNGKLSYGLSSYGYDARVHNTYKIFTDTHSKVIDPKNFSDSIYTKIEADEFLLPPHGFALARTVEYFKIPRDIIALCVGKSTYARCGILINVTPLEPEWEGYVTLEISNTSPLPAKIYSNEGICQFIFLRAQGSVCKNSYSDMRGKYMNQNDIVLPHVKIAS